MKVLVSEDMRFHLLSHFYYYEGKIDGKVISQLNSRKSKYFKSFVKNVEQLIEEIENKVELNSLKPGRNEISLEFEKYIGFDLLIPIDSDDDSYSLTKKMQIVIYSDNGTLNLVTAYPGKYAPPLPSPEIEDSKLFQYSKEFWSKYKISSFNYFEKTEEELMN